MSTHWVTLQNVVEYSLPAVSQSPQNMHYSTIVRYARLPNNISRAPWVYKTLGPEAIHAVWSQKEGVCPACRLIGHRPGDTGAPGAARARQAGVPRAHDAGGLVPRPDGCCVQGDTVILPEKMLEILAALVRHTWRCPLVGLLLMIAVSALLSWRVCTPHRPHRWVVRKGACPCCGSALFGTTPAYQRLQGLDLVCPENPYLCPACDGTKVAALQRQYRMERADD